MALYYKTIHELRNLLQKRELSVEELVTHQFLRIHQVEDRVRAFITLLEEKALNRARDLDRHSASGRSSTVPEKIFNDLTGIPIALKDNIMTSGIKTTSGSKMLLEYVPSYSATVVERLEKAGVIILGKTNLDEFAMGSSTENSAFYPTHNPWDFTRVPGGSSGGSAAAVASGEVVAALGSDTGGSIRQPAAFCGIVGLKPTYGLVSRYGLLAFASSMDQIGVLTRDVRDCALLMNTIAGHDPKDSTSVAVTSSNYSQALIADVRGLRIGIPKEYFVQQMNPEIAQMIEARVSSLTQLGATASQISLPHSTYALPTYCILAPAEASSNLSRYDGVRYGYRNYQAKGLDQMYCETRSTGFGSEVMRRIMLGTYILSSGYHDKYYRKAQQIRTLITRDFTKAFEYCDLIITPTTPTTAFKLQENLTDPITMYQSDIFTVAANLAGIPAISIPVGFTSEGLPVGLQIMGKPFDEATIFRAAFTLEQELGSNNRIPSL